MEMRPYWVPIVYGWHNPDLACFRLGRWSIPMEQYTCRSSTHYWFGNITLLLSLWYTSYTQSIDQYDTDKSTEWKGRNDGLVPHYFFEGGPNFGLAMFAFAVEGYAELLS